MSAVLDFLKRFGASRSVKAEAIAAGIAALTGSRPNMRQAQDDHGVYIEITPTEQQADILRRQLEAWLSKEPGDVRVNLSSIWTPVVMKRTLPWAALYGAACIFVGRKSV